MAPGLTDFWGDYDRVFERIAQARGLPYLPKSGINGQESREHALLQYLKDRLNPRMLGLRLITFADRGFWGTILLMADS